MYRVRHKRLTISAFCNKNLIMEKQMNRNKAFFKPFTLAVGIAIISSVFAACAKKQGKLQTDAIAQTNETAIAEVGAPIPSEKFSREKFAESLSQFISERQSQSRPQSLAEEENADEARLQTAQKLLDWTNESSGEEFSKWFSALKGGVYDVKKLHESDIESILREYDFQQKKKNLRSYEDTILVRTEWLLIGKDSFAERKEKESISLEDEEEASKILEKYEQETKKIEEKYSIAREKLKDEFPDLFELYQ